MVSIDNKLEKEISSSSILEEELSMSPSLPLMKVHLMLKLPMDILILVVKISITSLLNTAWPTSRRRVDTISQRTQELLEDLEHNARRQREFFHLHIKPQLSAKPLLKVTITTPTSQELSSKNFARVFSRNVCHQLRTFLRTPKLLRLKFMKSYLLVDQQEFQRSKQCSQISSTERLLTSKLTQMRPSLTELLFKLLSLLDKVMRRLKSSYLLMLPHFPWVSQ